MAAYGTKQTCHPVQQMSVDGAKRTQRVAIGATLARTTSNICPTLYDRGED